MPCDSSRDRIPESSRAFCEALLTYGEVLAVRLSYLPEALVWLVTSSMQARIMRAHRPDAVILTLGEARDLLTTLGDPSPTTLMEVAGQLATAAPGAPQRPDDEGDGDVEEYG